MLSDDVLPQPFRFINKLVNRCVDDAFEVIRRKAITENAHKRFNPPRSLHVHGQQEAPLLLTAGDTPETGSVGPLRPAEATAVHRGPTNIVFGFKSGRSVVHATESGEPLGVFSVKANEPVVAVAAAAHHCVFAAAAGNEIAVFYALSEEAHNATREQEAQAQKAHEDSEAAEGHIVSGQPEAAAATDSQQPSRPESRVNPGGAMDPVPSTTALAKWLTVGESVIPELASTSVADLTISDDCSFMAITLARSPPEVVCVRLPDPTAVIAGDLLDPLGNGGDDVPTESSRNPSSQAHHQPEASLAFVAPMPKLALPPAPPSTASGSKKPASSPQQPPSASPSPTPVNMPSSTTVRQGAICMFLCESGTVGKLRQRAQPSSLSRHGAVPYQPLARQLVVAWTGTNVFSTFNLLHIEPAQPPPPPAVVLPAASTHAPIDIAAPAAPTGKGGKSKGASAAAASSSAGDASGGDATGAGSRAGHAQFPAVSTGPSGLTPGVPAVPFDVHVPRERSHLLPHFISTAAMCRTAPRHDLVAFGCCDGVVAVWSRLRHSLLHQFNDAPQRLRSCPVNPMVTTNLAFYSTTHLIAGFSIPAGPATPTGTDHSRVAVFDLASSGVQCTVDFVPRLSWVGACSGLPVLLFNTAGRLFAANLYSGDLVGQIDLPVASASHVIPRTRDLNLLLEHCADVAAHAPVAWSSTNVLFCSNAVNDTGEPRKRLYHLDIEGLVFASFPLVEQFFHRMSVEQLAHVLRKVPDAAGCHKAEVLSAVRPPGTLHGGAHDVGSVASGHQPPHRKSLGASTMGGTMNASKRGSGVTTGSMRGLDTPASNRPAGTKSVGSRSNAPSHAAAPHDYAADMAMMGSDPASTPSTDQQRVQYVLASRESSRAQREQRFKGLWQAMQP